MKINYSIYTFNGSKLYEFESQWIFQHGEKIFIQLENKKRNFRIVKITHDVEVFNDNQHKVRLYVEEGKVY